MLVRDLVSRHDLDTATRAIGLLLLLYTQPPTRITKPTVDDVTDRRRTGRLAMRVAPVVVPPPSDDLIRRPLVHRHGHSSLGRTQPSPWLLPGGPPGQPIGVQQVIRRLQPLGIRARPSRNTTLIDSPRSSRPWCSAGCSDSTSASRPGGPDRWQRPEHSTPLTWHTDRQLDNRGRMNMRHSVHGVPAACWRK
jgi:hypothetical protein